MKIDLNKILSYQDLNEFEPSDIIQTLAFLFESSREHNDVRLIKKSIELAERQNLDKFTEHERMVFHYNLANGWSYHQRLTQKLNSESFWSFDMLELDKQIFNLRLAIRYSKNVKDDLGKCEILTNLGILFSHIGRFSEAQSYWLSSLEILPEFPMSIGNIGFGLSHYAKVLYDQGHKAIFLKIAHDYLSKCLRLAIYPEAKRSFNAQKEYIEKLMSENYLKKPVNFKEFKLGRSLKEREYRKWCLKNRLFINPLNDITINNIAAHDILFLPTMTLEINQSPIYQSIFNQIKQEFVSARFLLFEGISSKKTHFSDRQNLQMDTLDYATYSINIEKIKIAFRLCYSIFDKIAYLLNDYLKLGFEPDKVSFRKIWHKPNSKEINPNISKSHNWPLRGLYWLSKDIFENDMTAILEPDGQDIANIRNFIEHKSFVVVEFGQSGVTGDGLSYSIMRYDFEKKTLKLFKLVRSAIIYLSLAINLEEKGKPSKDGLIFPIEFQNFEDRFKI